MESDEIAQKIQNFLDGKNIKEDQISSEEALAILVYLNQSKADYQNLKNFTDKLGKGFLPPYSKVLEEKKKCLIDDDSKLNFSDTKASADLKATLDKDQERLMNIPWIRDSVENLKRKYGDKVKFRKIFKLGYDGSTQNTYKVRHN